MGLVRRTKFGVPPAPQNPSTHTSRLVPLTTGLVADAPWPMMPPGSAVSLTNYLPDHGRLIPRSRLSSINTIAVSANASGQGMYDLGYAIVNLGDLWISGTTRHAVVSSNGSVSYASFVSAFGLGPASLPSVTGGWQYTSTWMDTLTSDGGAVALAVPTFSHDTILCLYLSGAISGDPRYSYLTSAPKTTCIGSFDNYVLAFNIDTNSGPFLGNRVQWCVRGAPSNWTGEGSGFEDLLEMQGSGTAVVGMKDGRVALFTDREIWYGIRAAYPAQFEFFPLDNSVGCVFPRTIADIGEGLLFLGSDFKLRLLPFGGGLSRHVYLHADELLPKRRMPFSRGFAVFDKYTKFYHLYLEGADANIREALVINTETGEVSRSAHPAYMPTCGVSLGYNLLSNFTYTEGLMFMDDTSGNVLSTNSLISTDSATVGGPSVVTSTWQSPVLAPELPMDWKQVTEVFVDYRSTSLATIKLFIGQNNFSATPNATLSLTSAPSAGRAQGQLHAGGALAALKFESTSTGYELHRVDVGMNIGGRQWH